MKRRRKPSPPMAESYQRACLVIVNNGVIEIHDKRLFDMLNGKQVRLVSWSGNVGEYVGSMRVDIGLVATDHG